MKSGSALLKSLTLKGLARVSAVVPKHIAAKVLSFGGLRLESHDLKDDAPMDRYKNGATCALIVSLDFEYPRQDPDKAFLLREATLAILQVADRFGIPMTWGICGNAGLSELPLLNKIASSRVTHEMAVHTFSHTYVGSPDCPPNVLRDEVNECIEVIQRSGCSGVMHPRTFIFPGNRVGNLDALSELGFVAYRSEGTGLGYPSKTNGLWRFVPTYFVSEKTSDGIDVLKNLLDLALAYGCVLHLWSHPWNMILNGSAELFAKVVLEPFFRYADIQRRRDLVWTCTMGEMAEYCETRQAMTVDKSARN